MIASRFAPISRVARTVLLVAVAAASFIAKPAAAQNDAKSPDTPSFTGGPVLVIERASLDALLSDPKDLRFAKALAMLPARLNELPHEVPDMPPEAAEAINMLLGAVARPARIIVSYDQKPTGGALGYGVVLSVLTTGKEDAEKMHGRLTALLEQADNFPPMKPSKRFPGMTDIHLPVPVGQLSFGPREAKDGWRYEIVFGTVNNPDAGIESLPKPAKGFDPFVRARLDLAGLTPIVSFVQLFAGGNPQVQEVRKQLEDSGIVGDGAMKVSFQAGHTDKETVAIAVAEGAGRVATNLGMSKTPIDRADFAAIPADAVYASLTRTGGDWVGKMLAQARDKSEAVKLGLDQFKAVTQVDPQKDILDALGDLSGFYMSESTGGGGLGSAVFMNSVKNRDSLKSAFTKLAEFANTMAKTEAKGYLRIVPADARGDSDMFTIQFPGLPVPLELSVALTDRWLLVAPTPQAAMVASEQAMSKKGGLPSNPVFASAMPGDIAMTSMSFSDTAKSLRDGYIFLSLLGSGVSNLVRSPIDPLRDPGVTVPTYPDLMHGVRPRVMYSYWRADDYVMEVHSDHSMLVNLGSGAGSISRVLPAIAIPAAAIAAFQHSHDGPARMAPRKRPAKSAPGEDHVMLDMSSTPAIILGLFEHSLSPLSPERLTAAALEQDLETAEAR